MKWYTIKAKADVSEIWLYDEIGKDWFGEGVTAKEFLVELNAIKSPRIALHINSPGGAVFEGAAIYNAIKRHPATVTAYIDGIAASIASVIALAGEKVVMAANALYMMHNPTGFAIGSAVDMRKTADILDKVRDTMVGAYVEKSKQKESEIIALLDEETWLDADEAVAAGFADEIGEEIDLAACAKFIPVMSKLGYKHVPQHLQSLKTLPSQRELERLLRDAGGCSAKAAKTILARGYDAGLRDAGAADAPPQTVTDQRDVGEFASAGKGTTADLLIRAARITA